MPRNTYAQDDGADVAADDLVGAKLRTDPHEVEVDDTWTDEVELGDPVPATELRPPAAKKAAKRPTKRTAAKRSAAKRKGTRS